MVIVACDFDVVIAVFQKILEVYLVGYFLLI